MRGILVGLGLLTGLTVMIGCPQREAEPPPVVEQPVPRPEPAETIEEEAGPVDSDKTVLVIETEKGPITVELFDEKAPITAGNFLLLAESGFYDGLTIHRVEPGFVIQGGDPAGNGTGGPGFTIPDETGKGFTHDRGILSMAKTAMPDTAGSQFFIVTGSARAVSHLNQGFSPFGRVTEGMDVVDQIRVGDKIEKVEVRSVSAHAEAAREAAKEGRISDRPGGV